MENYKKPDFWSQKAQQEAYPARSVYKLKEMDEKFALLPASSGAKKSRFKVLDLGSAPGSWSLYVMRKAGNFCFLASIDMSPLSRNFDQGLFDKEEFFFVQGNMLEKENIEKIIANGPYNLVLSDAAPSTTGNRSVDTLRSLELAEAALDYAEKTLLAGGKFAVKVFQGGDTSGLLKRMHGLFEKAKSFKPQACRQGSFEAYYLGLQRKKA